MANTNTSPNMNLPVPVPSVDPGPDWAQNLYNCLYTLIDQHDHSTGKGVPVPCTSLSGTLQATQFPALTGDLTTSAGSLATTIGSKAVTAAKMGSGAASAGQVPTADGAGGVSYSNQSTAPDSSAFYVNGSLASSVATNALTIALKTKAGSDPSGGSPVQIGFRNATSGTGTYNYRSVSAALSITIPSLTTIGTQSGSAATIYVYALDNSGTVELAVSLALFDEGSIQSTTAISGGSSPTTIYSTSARVNVPIRLIGRLAVTEATAGTWASNATEVSNIPFKTLSVKTPTIQKFTATGTTTGYLFTISTSTTCAVGDTYSNNSNTYTVLNALSAQSGQLLFMSGASAPQASGNLTRTSGSGTATIAFTANVALATYTTPTSPAPLYIRVRGVGGGGGGSAAVTNAGGNGTTTAFGANVLIANGGTGGSPGTYTGGAGGSPTVNSPAIGIGFTGGGAGAGTISGTGTDFNAGIGGASIFGGNAPSPNAAVGIAAATNSGSGGSGGSTASTGGPGGGAGAGFDAIIPGPSSTYPYCIGTKGSGGTAGTVAGGNGADGQLIIEEFYA